jgi:mannose-6-phosphate isomerase class I
MQGLGKSNYDKAPAIAVGGPQEACLEGWDAVAERLRRAIGERSRKKIAVVVECYPGVEESEVLGELRARLAPKLALDARQAMLSPQRIEALAEPFLGGNDPVFGFLCGLRLPQFFDPAKVRRLQERIRGLREGLILVAGCGAGLIAQGDILVYADLARREAQRRHRSKATGNLGADNRTQAPELKYKRAFFVDWRVGDRWKRPLISKWDFVLDTHRAGKPLLAEGQAVRRGLQDAAGRPFRVVPFFDPAPWGGQWMKEACDLDRATANYGWCFDCVPEENSLLLGLGKLRLELPSIDLVFHQPRALLGEAVHARFGDEFPIRFDFLDTMGGGNLSFQVHPLTEYIQQHFGMHYTQDESYYLLDAGPDASVYLGLREGIEPAAMSRDLHKAQRGRGAFATGKYANQWPARKHDHFLIPAGTPHCSGKNSMVLEISATPYIFTFKMWDWDRPGLDGKPRPIHLEHGLANIQWERTTQWTRRNLVNAIRPVARGDGWREERTGLHEREFIETRRHWFTKAAPHDTRGGVNVLNLVQGGEAIIESPDRAFEPMVVHYAETFIVPAAVGPYTIRPHGARGQCATIKASVRT